MKMCPSPFLLARRRHKKGTEQKCEWRSDTLGTIERGEKVEKVRREHADIP